MANFSRFLGPQILGFPGRLKMCIMSSWGRSNPLGKKKTGVFASGHLLFLQNRCQLALLDIHAHCDSAVQNIPRLSGIKWLFDVSQNWLYVYCFLLKITLPETNIAPENRPLEKEIPSGNHHFQGRAVSFRENNHVQKNMGKSTSFRDTDQFF